MIEKSDNPFESIISELLEANSSISSTSGNGNNSASSWESDMIRWPHGATTNSGQFEQNFLNRAKEEDEKSKANTIKPYPLDFISDNIVDQYEALNKLKILLKQSLKYPNLGNEDKVILKKEIKNVKRMIDILQEMYYNIEKITL